MEEQPKSVCTQFSQGPAFFSPWRRDGEHGPMNPACDSEGERGTQGTSGPGCYGLISPNNGGLCIPISYTVRTFCASVSRQAIVDTSSEYTRYCKSTFTHFLACSGSSVHPLQTKQPGLRGREERLLLVTNLLALLPLATRNCKSKKIVHKPRQVSGLPLFPRQSTAKRTKTSSN